LAPSQRSTAIFVRHALAQRLDAVPDTDDPPAISVRGFLHLYSGFVAAHAVKEDDTWAHYGEAQALAGLLGHDRDDYRLVFGPTNVAIWGTSLGVELTDGVRTGALRAPRIRHAARTRNVDGRGTLVAVPA
jgi:hypothetical protein